MKKTALIVFAVILSTSLDAQDYYDDANSQGLPLLTNVNGSLFSSRINLKDNSIKINLFTFLKPKEIFQEATVSRTFVGTGDVLPSEPAEPKLPKATTKWGFGLNLKGKTEQNLGSLFSKGVFSPGFTGGVYAAHRTVNSQKDPVDKTAPIMQLASFETWLFSAQYSATSLRLFDVSRPFESMKIDSAFSGYSAGISWFKNIAIGQKFDINGDYLGRVSNIIFGASLEWSRKNNYSTLDSYEIKDYRTQVVDTPTGTTRIIQLADEEGYGYNKNNFKVFNNFKIRPHVNYIPGVLNNRIGIIFYPSVDIIENEKPRTNLGVGINILEKGIPSLSTAGVFFELNDISNNREVKNKTFIQRSFSVSIAASFNMFTGKQR